MLHNKLALPLVIVSRILSFLFLSCGGCLGCFFKYFLMKHYASPLFIWKKKLGKTLCYQIVMSSNCFSIEIETPPSFVTDRRWMKYWHTGIVYIERLLPLAGIKKSEMGETDSSYQRCSQQKKSPSRLSSLYHPISNKLSIFALRNTRTSTEHFLITRGRGGGFGMGGEKQTI